MLLKQKKKGANLKAFAAAVALPVAPGERDLYLAGYDIASPQRLAKALKLIRAHATGGQKSVYEIHLTQGERVALREAMRALMNPEEDRFFLLRLDRRAPVLTRGVAVAPSSALFFWVL
jgi:CRISPR-associated protein Cas2